MDLFASKEPVIWKEESEEEEEVRLQRWDPRLGAMPSCPPFPALTSDACLSAERRVKVCGAVCLGDHTLRHLTFDPTETVASHLVGMRLSLFLFLMILVK